MAEPRTIGFGMHVPVRVLPKSMFSSMYMTYMTVTVIGAELTRARALGDQLILGPNHILPHTSVFPLIM